MGEAMQLAGNPPIDDAVAAWVGSPGTASAPEERERGVRVPPGAGEVVPAQPGGEAIMPEGVVGAQTLRRWLTRLDRSLDAAALDAIWHEAGTGDVQRAAALTRFVGGSLGLPDGSRLDVRRVEAALAAHDGEARIVRLLGRGSTELEALAHNEAGVRRALATHSRWALTGERGVDALADPQGRFDRFDRDSGERLLSDAWLGDRARHASWLLRDNTRTVVGDGWRFVDRGDPQATVEVATANGGVTHQVIFAREGGDSVAGGLTTDRLHGGSGDDSLRGRGGDDLLEGGEGSDLLIGGSGRDDLAGGHGDDELDGGSGDDRLDGGSGADELAGGRGNDLLRGGAGADVYVFAGGDGTDVVEDDGGTIRIDEVELVGTMQRDGEAWRSADGRFAFTLEPPEPSDGAGRTLHVRDERGDAIALVEWRQGRYGITLADFDDELPEAIEIEHLALDTDSGIAATVAFLDAMSPAAVGSGSAVDWRALHSALAEWSLPVPPAVAGSTSESSVPTAADVAGVLAGGTGIDDTGEIALGTEDWTRQATAWWREGAVPSPPDLVPRRSPAA